MRIGPMMPGQHPVAMLAEHAGPLLPRRPGRARGDGRYPPRLEADRRGLADWLRGRKRDDTAFLLALDQFEELFTFADQDERQALRPPARRRPGRRRLPPVPDLDGAGRLPRSLR
jgi:hypothetical protein